MLNELDVKFIGEVSTAQKYELYNSAIATLCPIKFDEPFGLVFSESLACGTPVMAFRRGAAPEVISDGETGVIGENVDELVRRFGEIQNISPRTCRERVVKLFSKEKWQTRTRRHTNTFSQEPWWRNARSCTGAYARCCSGRVRASSCSAHCMRAFQT